MTKLTVAFAILLTRLKSSHHRRENTLSSQTKRKLSQDQDQNGLRAVHSFRTSLKNQSVQ
jgi:hypothetical protein